MELILRAVLFAILFLLQTIVNPSTFPIVPLCFALIYMASYLLKGHKIRHPKKVYVAIFFLLSTVFPDLIFYWPIIFYDLLLHSHLYGLFLLVFVQGLILQVPIYLNLMLLGLSLLASAINTIYNQSNVFQRLTYDEIDTLRHLNEQIKRQQQHLLEIQDEKVHISILKERRRLVQEIHDLLGHQLTSAIIQIGALEYLVEDTGVKQSLSDVKQVLSTGMNNVRAIIHAERQTTVNLQAEIQELVDRFTDFRIHFSYQNKTEVDMHMAHSLLNIIKEALTNVSKHAQATDVQIRFIELDKQWTLLIADNGRGVPEWKKDKGIGLLNIEERVGKMQGNIHFNHENGFRIFITIPMKERIK